MGIVKSHHGLINVYSELGKGTAFKYSFRLRMFSQKRGGEQLDHLSLPRGNGETVLVIDDEASILTITGETLQEFGYRVLTATDGAEAVAVYGEHKDEVSLVLIDMAMPRMDGPVTIPRLNANQSKNSNYCHEWL